VNAAQLVILFDNTLQPATSLQAVTRSQLLVRNLRMVDVKQAAFLIDTYGLDAKNEERLALYSNAGHLLVNAGHNDFLMSRKNIYRIQMNLLKADAYLRPYLGYKKNLHLDWLNETSDMDARNKLIQFISDHEFEPAFSGILPMRAADEYINQLYQKRKRINKPVSIEKIGKAYAKLIADDLDLYNAYASFTLGYSPVQILTLQENDVTVYSIVALVDELNKRGWQIIPSEKAFSDPVANTYAFFGFGANSYWKSVAPFLYDQVSYPRVIGDRKVKVDQVLQQYVPELFQ